MRKNWDETASDNDGLKHALSDPFLGLNESIQIHIFKISKFTSTKLLRVGIWKLKPASSDSDQNKQTYQTDFIDVLCIVLDIYIYIYILILCHVRYGIWTFTDQRGVLGCSKKVGLIFEENPTTWQRYHLLRTRAPGKLKDYLWCLAFWYLLFISRDTTTRTTTTIHFQVSVTLFFFLWTLLDTSTKSQVTCASTSCCIFSCISVSSYGGDYDDFFSSIWFRWLLHLRVEMGHICMYNISILHVTKNEKTQDTKHESNVSYLPYNMALPNAARNTKYQRLNRLG